MAIRRYDIGGPEDGALHVGEWWSAVFDVDLTSWAGWTAKAQIRATKTATAVLVELACDTSVAGQVTVSLPAGETAVLGAFTGYWDLLVKPAVGDGQYIAEGTVTVTDLVSFTNTFPQPGTWARVGASVATNTAGSPAVVATSPRSGSYCLELSSTSAAENLTWTTGAGKNLTAATVQTWSERLHVYLPSLPSGDTELASVEVSSLANGMVLRYVAASQKLGVKIGTGSEQLSDATVTSGQWIGVDFLYDPRTTTHTCQWQVDYNADLADTTGPVAQTAASTAAMTAGGVTTVRHGWTTAITATVRYDDIVGSRHRKTFPIGDVRIRPLKVDPSGTPTATTAANFRTFTSNGTLATWTAAATITTLDDLPPTIGAAADGLTQITNSTTDYVEVPMETLDLAANNVAPICGRWYWAGWAASGNPATFKFRPYDTVFGVTVTTVYGDTLDAGFDSTALVWMGMIHNTNAALNNFYPLTQTKLNALAAQFGFSEDTNPDAGVHRWGGDDLCERAGRC